MLSVKWLTHRVFSRHSSGSSTTNSSLPQHMTTPADRFWLKFTRTLPADKIGSEVPQSVMEKALNRRRIGVNVGMCVVTMFIAMALVRNQRKKRAKQVNEHDFRYKKAE